MSAIKSKIIDFLFNGGTELGYSNDELPKLDDFDAVITHKITVWDYNGKTEQEYYGGSYE